MSNFPISQHITTDDFLQPRNDGIIAWDGHRLALKSSRSLEVFLMLETVCRNHCTMGWPWDGRHRIISSTPIRWDGAHLSSAGVRKNSSATRNPPPPPLPSYLIFGGPKWPYIPFGSTILLVAPSSISGFFQAPASIIKTPPSEYLWAGLAERSQGSIQSDLLASRRRRCFFFLFFLYLGQIQDIAIKLIIQIWLKNELCSTM